MIILNLTHGQRPYALIGIVITDEGHRGRGLASACLEFAGDIARRQNCYKIMLMTGREKESTLEFYRKAGCNSEDKAAFIKWLWHIKAPDI